MRRANIWTAAELEALRHLWPSAKRKVITEALPQRSWRGIYTKAYDLKLRRNGKSNYFTNPLERLPELGLAEMEKLDVARMLDTEGSIGIAVNKSQRVRPYYRPHIHFANTDQRLLEHYRRLARCTQKSVAHYPTAKKKRLYQVWVVENAHIYALLQAIRPYFVIKGEQADLVMEFIHIQGERTNQATFITELTGYSEQEHEIVRALRRLNWRGRNIQAVREGFPTA